ncbi:MAG: carboxypeptidase-like regulatory domain-containing protein [Bacteroidales bacterium]|nr:carboxypeptidase-like regulatory domain-containing protein [Bacteroidales bacterium]MDD3844097.1 carboxypeptidase-like regulatory domain-containing protein [Bacteroidales bacterium]MDD4618196.1 carboxypeptidase-like regulatory domain-containing protein [Bacteroidales bacterium]
MKRLVLIFFITILSSHNIWSQGVISLSGKVEDASSKRPLGFASIHLSGSTTSIVTNTDGMFVFKVPAEATGDTVIISYLGYKSRKIAVSDFEEREMNIPLTPSIITLKPITIRPQDASSIVKMALSRTKLNYSQSPLRMTAFYREMIQKRNTYVSINEAVLDIAKAPYTGYRSDMLGIYKARGNYDANRVDTLMVKFQGGPNSAFELDIMKNPFLGVDPFIIDEIYNFKISDPATIDDKLFYVIDFDQHNKLNDIFFRGKIFIEAESFAVGRIEFAMNVEDNPNANQLFIKKKPSSLKMDVLAANYLVNYKQFDSLWYFDYSRTEVKFAAKWDKKWFRNIYTISSEVAVTDIKPTQFKIESQNRVRSRDIMSEKVNDFTDENFWEDYNVIEPEASIEKVISRIVRQLRKRE